MLSTGEKIAEDFFCGEGGETGTGCPERWWMPLPGNIQGQVGWGSEQSGLVQDAPAHCRQAVDYQLVKPSVVTKMRKFISDTLT